VDGEKEVVTTRDEWRVKIQEITVTEFMNGSPNLLFVLATPEGVERV
jgi:hypothetical protein